MVCDLLCSIFAPLTERHLLPLEYTCLLAKQLKAWGLGIGRRIARRACQSSLAQYWQRTSIASSTGIRQYWRRMTRYFALDTPFHRFAANTLIVSCLSLAPLLLLYVLLTPGFAALLLDNRVALGRLLRQVATNGLPVVFVINYISFFIYALVTERTPCTTSPTIILLGDLSLRVIAFVGLHAFIYVLSAGWFGSFGGDRMLALRVVGPTLVDAARFGNISGVYLYSTLASALLLYATVIDNFQCACQGDAKTTPCRTGRNRGAIWRVGVALLIFATFVGLVTGLAALIAWVQVN